MPFTKVGKNKNVSPSGRVFTDKQVKLYYATDGFKNMDEEEMKPVKKNIKPKMKKKDLVEYIKFKKDGGYKKFKKSDLLGEGRKDKYDFPRLLEVTNNERKNLRNYLEAIRQSGLINMFGAYPILNWAKDDLHRWLYGQSMDIESLEQRIEDLEYELETEGEDSGVSEGEIEGVRERKEIIEYLLDNKREVRDILIRGALKRIDNTDGNHETRNVQRVFEKMAKEAFDHWSSLLSI
tara:strand:+ start:476 stop:1183 length:708 start_codon:yes stop_codon:yes gene_type:complete